MPVTQETFGERKVWPETVEVGTVPEVHDHCGVVAEDEVGRSGGNVIVIASVVNDAHVDAAACLSLLSRIVVPVAELIGYISVRDRIVDDKLTRSSVVGGEA